MSQYDRPHLINLFLFAALLAAWVWACVAPAGAATLTATPATFAAQLAKARGGDTIILAGAGGTPRVVGSFAPPLTIDAGGATLAGLQIYSAKGIDWRGGVITCPLKDGSRCVDIRGGAGIAVTGSTVRGAYYGITATDTVGLSLTHNLIELQRADGIHLCSVRAADIGWNVIGGAQPRRPYVSAAGKLIDGDHADAVQFRTCAGMAPIADLWIHDNRVSGDSQGITGWASGQKMGPRITIERNQITVQQYAAIALQAAGPGSAIRSNRLELQPGHVDLSGRKVAFVQIDVRGSQGVEICGTTAAPGTRVNAVGAPLAPMLAPCR